MSCHRHAAHSSFRGQYFQRRVHFPQLTGRVLAPSASARTYRQQVTVGKSWQRCEFSFMPQERFLFIAIGLDLEASRRDAATLWLDAVQLERGDHATAYEPRRPVESFIETSATGT